LSTFETSMSTLKISMSKSYQIWQHFVYI
jgi:hypothetical protein